MKKLAAIDQAYVWHPFTQMRDWMKHEPTVICSGQGAVLTDAYGRRFLDANSSIWTNLHGHNHPRINLAITRQLEKIAHSSALGLANEPATLLARDLVEETSHIHEANRSGRTRRRKSNLPGAPLQKVFFSDDGSTALEVALKLAYEFTRRTAKILRPRFLSLDGAYHGDTVGAVSVGHIDLFHKSYAGLLFKSDKVMAPYCYRCPYNRAKPSRVDAREARKCRWECVDHVEHRLKTQKRRGPPYAAFIYEPLLQGAAGMIPQPNGWLHRVASLARDYGALLIADEVMTGFGRCGGIARNSQLPSVPGRAVSNGAPRLHGSPLIASHQEGVQPDLLCLAKGLTGGYLPMAATLVTSEIFQAFLGEYKEFKSFFHGHSYTSNQLGAAAARASLQILRSQKSRQSRSNLERAFAEELEALWDLDHVGDVRRVGLVAGIELVKDWRTRKAYDLTERVGGRICERMAQLGVLTRPIGNVIVLMPPYCTTRNQIHRMVAALQQAVRELL